jgi:hypothetical protein
MSGEEMKEYYGNYRLKIDATEVSIQCVDGSKQIGPLTSLARQTILIIYTLTIIIEIFSII